MLSSPETPKTVASSPAQPTSSAATSPQQSPAPPHQSPTSTEIIMTSYKKIRSLQSKYDYSREAVETAQKNISIAWEELQDTRNSYIQWHGRLSLDSRLHPEHLAESERQEDELLGLECAHREAKKELRTREASAFRSLEEVRMIMGLGVGDETGVDMEFERVLGDLERRISLAQR